MRFSLEILIGASVAVLTAATGAVVYFRTRTCQDPEARRRALIDGNGRIIEGYVTDFGEGVVVYRWSWRGVQYEASQDLRSLTDRLPENKDVLLGPVSVKFLPRDPANSIVISEQWSGFRELQRKQT